MSSNQYGKLLLGNNYGNESGLTSDLTKANVFIKFSFFESSIVLCPRLIILADLASFKFNKLDYLGHT